MIDSWFQRKRGRWPQGAKVMAGHHARYRVTRTARRSNRDRQPWEQFDPEPDDDPIFDRCSDWRHCSECWGEYHGG